MLHQGLPPHQLEDDEDEDEPGEDDEDDAGDDGLDEHHLHGHGPNNVLMNAEEGVGVNEEGVDFDDDMGDMEIVDEDGDELGEEEEEENGDDLDDYEFDVESDDDRDVNALDPLYLQFGRGMHGGGRHRGGRGGQRDERDILFNQNDHADHGGGGLYLGGYRNAPRPLGGNAFARFDHGNAGHDDEHGRNWSREEEEVS